jgi:hypothetical protein
LVQKLIGVLGSAMPADQSKKSKPNTEADCEDKTHAGDKDAVRPVDQKIPEGKDNLRRRADWFQKRSGQS